MSNTIIICEVSEVTFRFVLCTSLYAMAYTKGRVHAMYMVMYISKNIGFLSAHIMYITTYKAMYVAMYVMLYMYAKCGQLLNDFGHNSRRSICLDAFDRVLMSNNRNLAIEVVTSHFCEVTNRVFRRNLATGLLKSLGKTHFARLARLHSTILTYREINVHVMYMYIPLYAGVRKITSLTSLTSQSVKNPTFLAIFYPIPCEVTSKTSFCVTSLTSQSVTGG
jgi:hypothetical protein